MSFDATQNDISDLFASCGVTNVRIVEDKLTRTPKGFGYVEFATVDGLKKALDLSGATLQGRSIRISVADPRKCRLLTSTVKLALAYSTCSQGPRGRQRIRLDSKGTSSRLGPTPCA